MKEKELAPIQEMYYHGKEFGPILVRTEPI